MSPWAWHLFGAVFYTGFLLLCIAGLVCMKREGPADLIDPPSERRDYHRKTRTYARGEVIKL